MAKKQMQWIWRSDALAAKEKIKLKMPTQKLLQYLSTKNQMIILDTQKI